MWFSEVCTLIDNDTRHHSGHSLRAGSLICKGIAGKEKECPRLILLAGFAGVQLPNKWACSQARVVKCCGLTRPRRVSPQQILTNVMTCIVGDKSTDHANHIRIVFYHNIKGNEKIFARFVDNWKHRLGLESARAQFLQISFLYASDFPFKNFCKRAQHAEKIRSKCLGKE